jgi:hypothetical protein
MVAIDRGYNDYAWYNQLTGKGIFFVTRLKSNAKTRVVSRRLVLSSKGLSSDQTIVFTGVQTAKKCPIQLRRIGYRDPETGKHYVFLTNNFKLAAKTIADIYKARWQVGVPGEGRIIQSVKVRPRPRDSGLVAWEAPWRESKTVKPSDNVLALEYSNVPGCNVQ